MSNPIITENLNTGSTAWNIGNNNNALGTAIQGYVDQCSYNVGDTITFSISTLSGGTTYTIYIYRMGYYGGTGGCLKYTSSTQTGVAQGYYDSNALTLNNCPTAVNDATTGLLEPRWASSFTLSVPSWTTGCYLALLVDASNNKSYIPFIIKGNTTAPYLAVRPVMRDCAYNAWGGKSLYGFNSTSGVAAVKDSFDRPNILSNGAGSFFNGELHWIKWAEKSGYNLSYTSNIDTHVNPGQLLNYKATISLGHDEYWTKAQRDGWEASIAAGVHAAFMGGNDCYWQARLETGGLGGVNRTLVVYRSTGTDPQYGVNNAIVTVNWVSSPVNRPQSTMIGLVSGGINQSTNVAWTTDASMDTTYTAGTGLVAGTSYGTDIVGNEFDKVGTGSPSNIKVIGTTSLTDSNNSANTSQTTTYKAPSGAIVFAAGSIEWACCLDNYRANGTTVPVIPGMQYLFANIMGAMNGPVYGNLG